MLLQQLLCQQHELSSASSLGRREMSQPIFYHAEHLRGDCRLNR